MSEKLLTFGKGIHPTVDGKELSCNTPIKLAPLLDKYQVIVCQNVGKSPKVIVKVGDEVKKYQLIAEADGFVSTNLHAPTSGKVTAIKDVPNAVGAMVPAIEISSDMQDEAGELMPKLDWQNTDGATLKKRISDAGIVGMGGAAFPSSVKLSPPPEKGVDTLIINGAECEPYLSADHRIMVESPEEILIGTAILAKALGVTKVFIGIENNKEDAIAELKTKSSDYGIQVCALKVQYPQGSEKQLIYATTNRKVPRGGLPMDAKCVVQNVGTALATYEAVVEGIPSVERVTTITGETVKNPGNWKLKLGTPILKAIELAGGITEPVAKVIMGGPMMGFAQRSLEVPICKNSSGVLLLPYSRNLTYESTNCIRCGRCVEACPMNLSPCTLASYIEGDRIDLAEANYVMDCIECGSCAYICPANRPLVQHFRRAKAAIRKFKK